MRGRSCPSSSEETKRTEMELRKPGARSLRIARNITQAFNVLSVMPHLESIWVAENAGPVSDHTRSGALAASTRFEDLTDPDIVGAGTGRSAPPPSRGYGRVDCVEPESHHAASGWTGLGSE